MSDISVPVGELEESPGVASSMRRNVRAAVRAGKALILGGIGLSAGMLIYDRYELIPVAVAMIAGGPSLILGALGAKAWQAQAENR